MLTFNVQGFIHQLREWVRDDLPGMNDDIEHGRDDPALLVAAFGAWVGDLFVGLGENVHRLDCWEARRLIQLLGFGISSIEKHYRERGCAAGESLRLLSNAEGLMMQLGVVARHPPRDTHYTYWLWNNSGMPLTFTGSPQEGFFNYAVNMTEQLHSLSCNALRPICEGNISITAPQAVEALHSAAHNTQQLYEVFRSFMRKNADGTRKMEPEFFMTWMRTYLLTYPISDVEWGGVNAANLAAQMQIDYLIGTVNDSYTTVVEGRWRYLTDEDQRRFALDMALPSLADAFLERLRVDSEQILNGSDDDLHKLIYAQHEPLRAALAAYRALVIATARLTAMHWALIQNYLVKPAQNLSPDERAAMAVQPDAGTGGKTHAETEAIMRMRREHPIVWKLIGGANG